MKSYEKPLLAHIRGVRYAIVIAVLYTGCPRSPISRSIYILDLAKHLPQDPSQSQNMRCHVPQSVFHAPLSTRSIIFCRLANKLKGPLASC